MTEPFIRDEVGWEICDDGCATCCIEEYEEPASEFR